MDADLLARLSRVHFVGVGGIGMSALAELLLRGGKQVSGSDVQPSAIVERLRSLGVHVTIGHAADAVQGAELVVATAAARPDNPELLAAARLGIPVVKRARLLGWLMSERYGLAVAGTHGKTTTTGLVAYLLHRAGLDPTALIGGEPLDFDSNGLLGQGQYLVAEADEFDRSFLCLWPRVAIVTSVEADHLDCYADLQEIADAFAEFASRVPGDGLLVTCADDPILRRMVLSVPRCSYGFAPDADWRVTSCSAIAPFGTRFSFEAPDGSSHAAELRLSGRHYALDALAAVAAVSHVGIDPGSASSILRGFQGTRRRFELLGEAVGVLVLDDYAHHPTAVRETLRAAKERHPGRILCVFQPHTANRTRALMDEFASAFGDCDHLLVLPVYQPAGREEGAGATNADLVDRMRHPDARAVGGHADAVSGLEREVKPGDLVITMGAGDVQRVGEELLRRLRT